MAAIILTLTLTGQAAYAHTDDELDRWRSAWATRAIAIGGGEWPTLGAEYADMARRHPRYFGLPVPHVHARSQRAGFGAGVEQWRPLVATYFRPGDVSRALRIMRCESGGVVGAYNPSGASGLFQHLKKYWPARSQRAGFAGASVFDPTANVATAAWLRDQPGGWLHWRACL